MKSLLKNPASQIATLALACAVALGGCQRPTPEGASTSYAAASVGKGQVICSQFHGRDKGQTVVICCDFSGTPVIEASNGSKQQGFLSSTDGKQHLDWQTERTEDWNIKVRLNGKEYDASKGPVFLVKTEGEKTQIEQLAKDLSALLIDPKRVEDFARKDAAVSKFLGIKAD